MGSSKRLHLVTEEEIKAICAGLQTDPHFDITSPEDFGQNCFGFAADEKRRWDPAPIMAPTTAGVFWPAGVPLLNTVSAFRAAYATIGYEPCPDAEVEAGFEKIALYVDESGEPTHAARQYESGIWASKLGGGNDIVHGSPEALDSTLLGRAAHFLRRRIRG
jgi:hypothetical protein